MSSISNLETLPDELLLEICKYLLCVDVLFSFDHLNQRFYCLISDYRHSVSLHKASYAQSYQLCTKILPKIGSQIHTLSIDNCYSALQAIIFPKYFHDRMSICFPRLEKIILISFGPDPLLVFLKTLINLEYLLTIELRSLFRIPTNQQTDVLLALFQANNQRLQTIIIDDQSSQLNPIKKFLRDKQYQYSNILNLKIELSTICDLFVLFHLIPNIRSLNVSINKKDNLENMNRLLTSTSLVYLKDFQFKSVQRSWSLDDLLILIQTLPTIEYLSLNLRTSDIHLTNGQILKTSLSKHIQSFHYAIHYLPEQIIDINEILNSWKFVCPIVCLYNSIENDYIFLHTLPYSSFDYLEISSSVARTFFNQTNFYSNIQRLHIDCELKLIETFPILAFCQRIKHAMIWLHGNEIKTDYNREEMCLNRKKVSLPKLIRLRRLTLVGLPPNDLENMCIIIDSSPNLFRLDLNYDTLINFLENFQLCQLFQQRITALTINNMPSSSQQGIKSISQIASVFLHLQHLYLDMRHLDMIIDCLVRYFFEEFFKQHIPLISFCVDGKPSNEIKQNAKEWLLQNLSYLQNQNFNAFFNDKAGRLLIWL